MRKPQKLYEEGNFYLGNEFSVENILEITSGIGQPQFLTNEGLGKIGFNAVVEIVKIIEKFSEIIIREDIRSFVHGYSPLPISIISKEEVRQQASVHFNENTVRYDLV
jgi:hypothetical protein